MAGPQIRWEGVDPGYWGSKACSQGKQVQAAWSKASTEEIPTQFFYLVVCVNEPLYYLRQGLHVSCYV